MEIEEILYSSLMRADARGSDDTMYAYRYFAGRALLMTSQK